MTAIFINLFNMSITASWLVLAVVLLRLLLKKAPKALTVTLWAIVALRLIFPFSIESALSLIPSVETVPQEIVYAAKPTIDTGVDSINSIVNPIITDTFAPSTELTSVNPIQVFLAIVANLWILGMIAMVLYALISYLRISHRVREAVKLRDNIYVCDSIPSPFILGVFRPRIFLPSAMDNSDMEYVIAHEKAHLSRRDHWWKPLGFALLSVYWFNPVLWVAYILLCRDIELACDERVIRDMDAEDKKAYSCALLNCSMPRRMISACPLAFGEVGVKQRIKSVLHYKKPAFWLIVAAIVIVVAVAVGFLTNPKEEDYSDLPSISAHAYAVDHVAYEALYLSSLTIPGVNTPFFSITEDLDLLRKTRADTNEGWVNLGKLESITLSKSNFDELLAIAEGFGWADRTSAATLRKENARAWKLDAEDLHYVLQQKDGSVYLAFGHKTEITRVFKLKTDIREDMGIIAMSGANTVPVKGLTTEYSLEEIKNEVYWLDITFDDDRATPFDIYTDGKKQLGIFNIYDANTLEPLEFFHPSGLSPHTYIFQNAVGGGEYIITMRYSLGEDGSDALFCFGARLPQFSALATFESEQTYIKEEKGIKSFSDEWYKSNEIYSTSINYGAADTVDSYSAPMHRFDTLAELEAFKANFEDVYIFDKTYQEVPSFNAATEKYDNSFFENNSLFVIHIASTSGACRYTVESIVNDGKSFVANVGLVSGPRTDDWQEWFVTLAIAKSEIESCTAFDAQVYAKEVAAEDVKLTSLIYRSGVVQAQLADYKSAIYKTALNSDKLSDGHSSNFPIHKIESLDELNTFKEDFADVIAMSYGDDEMYFANITYHCDEEFFEDTALLAAYILAPCCDDEYEVSGISIDHTGFTMLIEKSFDGRLTALGAQLAYVFIDKDRIADCPAFNAILTNEPLNWDALLGTWEMPIGILGLPAEEVPENPTLKLSFKEDHTGVENAAGAIREFVYETQNDLLEITYDADGDSVQYTFRISGDMLTLSSVRYPGRIMDLKKTDARIPVNEEPSGTLAMSFFKEQNLPQNPKRISEFTFDFEQNENYSVLSGANKEYLDNAMLSALETAEPVFSFSIYQDSLEYTEPLLEILNSVVTVDYEGNTYDAEDAIKKHIFVALNGIKGTVTEVRLGKGNGHLEFSFKFSVGTQFSPGAITSFDFSVVEAVENP